MYTQYTPSTLTKLNKLSLCKMDIAIYTLLLLDMSATFDTLDHSTLLNRFHEEFGIIGKQLK